MSRLPTLRLSLERPRLRYVLALAVALLLHAGMTP